MLTNVFFLILFVFAASLFIVGGKNTISRICGIPYVVAIILILQDLIAALK